MATARVKASEVKEVVATSLTDQIISSNMIVTANAVVNDILETDAGLSVEVLKSVELYLAAHFVALTEEGGALTRDKMGDADQSYANIYESGFKGTRFGQTALSLDSSGKLAAASQTMLKASFRVV